jgi:hypothetical protein
MLIRVLFFSLQCSKCKQRVRLSNICAFILSVTKENWTILKCKVGSESIIFQEKCTYEQFCVSVNGKALCLICSKSNSVVIEYNVAMHYN